MGDDFRKKQRAAGIFTHWARPRWIRMYSYNYEYGESYYRPQVRYISTSKYSSSSEYNSSSTTSVEAKREYVARRKATSPPRALSYIERWAQEPFYGRGFAATSEVRVQSRERAMSELKDSRSQSDMRSRRAQSELSTASNYASTNLLNQMRSVRASSVAVQEESQRYEHHQRQRRARSVESSYSAECDAHYASDDCLMRSSAMDSSSRHVREGSLTRRTLGVDDNNMLKGKTLDGSVNYEYPLHHLVCTDRCPSYTNKTDHSRFVMGNKFTDAASLGGFDVLYDPTVYKKTRKLLQKFSEERQVEATIYESSRETDSQSRGVYSYNTRY